MTWKFETLGNAIVQVFKNDRPVLMTDPWLTGTAYFGSWGLERPLTARQIDNCSATPFVWFSHGHPDHFHLDSLELLHADALFLLPDHYDNEIARTLTERKKRFRILKNKEWVELEPGLRILCVANENMDAILAIEAGGVLILNKNDSPFCGENAFFRKLVRGYDQTYLTALCAFDADMLNLHDSDMRFAAGSPEERKPGVVWATGRICRYLGVRNFCCSSSQHVYVRADSAWANDYRTTYTDIAEFWTAPETRLIPPFSTIDLQTGAYTSQVNEATTVPGERIVAPEESWNDRLSEHEWSEVERFVRRFEILQRRQDFIAFTVGGERRDIVINPAAASKPLAVRRGVHFAVPKNSLLQTIEYGYFDDLLIGNFMKTQLYNMNLYFNFTPTIAKLGGNAKVFTAQDFRRFKWYFFKLSPRAFIRYRLDIIWTYTIEPWIRRAATKAGMFEVLKWLRAKIVGAPKALSR